MTNEVKEKLRNLAEKLSKSSDREELIAAAVIFTTLGSIEMNNLGELEDLMFKFAKKQIAVIDRLEKISHMQQN